MKKKIRVSTLKLQEGKWDLFKSKYTHGFGAPTRGHTLVYHKKDNTIYAQIYNNFQIIYIIHSLPSKGKDKIEKVETSEALFNPRRYQKMLLQRRNALLQITRLAIYIVAI
ncbi:hypothetical protein L6164_004076 [Bauhinia variegata]|uniref:Uncharacterized protein n=1 Tax=Bauhinia variegata TaxID=167791 RepID=A0ACB9Q2Q2_BAUVA|nr:hypothetical protein L6164_004076 [Bauhinia variegata]